MQIKRKEQKRKKEKSVKIETRRERGYFGMLLSGIFSLE